MQCRWLTVFSNMVDEILGITCECQYTPDESDHNSFGKMVGIASEIVAERNEFESWPSVLR